VVRNCTARGKAEREETTEGGGEPAKRGQNRIKRAKGGGVCLKNIARKKQNRWGEAKKIPKQGEGRGDYGFKIRVGGKETTILLYLIRKGEGRKSLGGRSCPTRKYAAAVHPGWCGMGEKDFFGLEPEGTS